MAAGFSSVLLVKEYVLFAFRDLAPSPDLILDRLPTVTTVGLTVWGPALITVLALGHLAMMPRYAPFTFKAVGVLYLLRALFILLTPLGIRSDAYSHTALTLLQAITYGGNDFFFSGHVAFPFLFALIFWRHQAIRSIYLALTVIIAVAVLLEHVHYSVDVFGAPFIVFGVWMGCRRVCKKDWERASA